jgi:hypothetical protein
MPKQDTRSDSSPQDHPNLRTSADGREWSRRKRQFLAAVKFNESSNMDGKMCEDHDVSHHLTVHVANEIANIHYNSSLARLRTFAHCKYRGGSVL